MAHARPITTDDPFVGPLIPRHPDGSSVSIVVSTRPEAHLRSGDRRRLARAVSGAERRLTRAIRSATDRRRVMRRLWDLADDASRRPASQGVALVANPYAGRLLELHHPAIDRILVGPAPTLEELVEQCWGFARIAVLHVTERGARLVAHDGGAPWEPAPPWHPGDEPRLGVLGRADLLARSALPPRTPLVLAGDDRLVSSFMSLHGSTINPECVLAGDHSETSPAALLALALRALRTSVDQRQQAAMVSVMLAFEHGTARAGAPSSASVVSPDELVVIEKQVARRLRVSSNSCSIGEGSVVVVPDGFVDHPDGVVRVPDHRGNAVPRHAAPEREPEARAELRRLTLVGANEPC